MKNGNNITCQCGRVLLTGDDIYNHLQSTGHQLKTTTYNVEDYHLIEQMLFKWRIELYSAIQLLQGEHLEQLKTLIAEIATCLKLQMTDTGTFEKLDV